MSGFWTYPEKYAAFLQSTGLSLEDAEMFARNWTLHLGMMGYELVELLGHFHSPTLSFELKPPAADLAERARKAIFWRTIEDVRISSGSSLSTTIGDGGTCIRKALNEEFRASLLNGLGYNLWRLLWDSFGDCGLHRYRLDSLVLKGLRSGGLVGRLTDDLWQCIRGGVEFTLFCAAGFLIIGDETKDFRPLLSLWRTGNLPVGFDQGQKTLVVLGKDKG